MRIKQFLAPIIILSAINGPKVLSHPLGRCPADPTIPGLALRFLPNICLNSEYTPTNLSLRVDFIGLKERVKKKGVRLLDVLWTVALIAAFAFAIPVETLAVAIGLTLEEIRAQAEIRAEVPEARIPNLNRGSVLRRGEATFLEAIAANSCAICLENFIPGEEVLRHRAENGGDHTFHDECMQTALMSDHENQRTHKCPLCRVELIIDLLPN